MTKMELEAFRHELLKLERRCQGDVNTLRQEAFHKTDGMVVGNLSNYAAKDRAELASDNYREETTIGLAENATLRLGEINAALGRIDMGTFGRCDACGQNISSDRLRAVPFVRQCIDCARKAQQGEAAAPANL
jgi:DnaK suppressor protein